jgi:hypothetical protein
MMTLQKSRLARRMHLNLTAGWRPAQTGETCQYNVCECQIE